MFAPLAPILAADTGYSAEALAILQRVEALEPVLATVARIAGDRARPAADALAMGADLSGSVMTLSPETARTVADGLDTVGAMLQAGLLALDKSRAGGRFSQAAARVLHLEASEQYRKALTAAGLLSHS
jgi:hypothetical protein